MASVDPQVPVLRVRSFKLRQEEWYGSLPGHTVRNHRSDTYKEKNVLL